MGRISRPSAEDKSRCLSRCADPGFAARRSLPAACLVGAGCVRRPSGRSARAALLTCSRLQPVERARESPG
eukprot:3780487-Alexandrium_andersonii.AAC.1